MTISEIIFNLYGLKEVEGEGNNPEVLRLYAEIGHSWVKKDSVAWCAALANYVLKTAGFPYQKTLSAKSFTALGEKISNFRPLGSSQEFVDIALFYRGKPWTNEDPEYYEPGHVAFPLNERVQLVYVVGGNQGNMLKISGYDRRTLEQYRRIVR